jgi:hypothetical protein
MRKIRQSISDDCTAFSFQQIDAGVPERCPLSGNLIQIAPSIFQSALLHLPTAFATEAMAADKTCAFEHTQMLSDRLTSDAGIGGQPGNGRRAFIAKPGDNPQTGFIAERRKYGG